MALLEEIRSSETCRIPNYVAEAMAARAVDSAWHRIVVAGGVRARMVGAWPLTRTEAGWSQCWQLDPIEPGAVVPSGPAVEITADGAITYLFEIVDEPRAERNPSARRFADLAAALRSAAQLCEAQAHNEPEIIGRAARQRAQLFRRAAAAAEVARLKDCPEVTGGAS